MVHYTPKIFSGEEWVSVFDENDNWYPPTPASDSKIWRYRSLKRYIQILDEESLWFARTDHFDDPYEGSLPDHTFERWCMKLNRLGLNHQNIFDVLQKMTHINCWHENSSESVAMWDLYLEDGQGVAIISSPSRLWEALQIDEEQYVTGNVEYIDYSNESFNMDSTITPFFHKRESFQHEREYRVLHRDTKRLRTPEEGIAENDISNYTPDGIPVSVDLNDLIKEVRVSPVVDDGFYQKVKSETRERGYEYPITRSDLTGEPIF